MDEKESKSFTSSTEEGYPKQNNVETFDFLEIKPAIINTLPIQNCQVFFTLG